MMYATKYTVVKWWIRSQLCILEAFVMGVIDVLCRDVPASGLSGWMNKPIHNLPLSSGIHYVEELLPETNRDSYDPQYTCGLCNMSAAPASNMFSHLTGLKHRLKYLGMRLHISTSGMDRSGAREKAKELEAEDGLRVELLKTVFSKDQLINYT
jgi:hypothetical protein